MDAKRYVAWSGLLALTVVSLVAAAPPVMASYYETGVSFSGRIVRASVPYRLNVKAIEAMGYTYSLEVSITGWRDPKGPAAARQTQRWVFDLEEGDFRQDGDTYYIDAGGNGGPFEVDVVIDGRKDSRCGENQRLFVSQPEGGAFRIETGNSTFGTITELPDCGKGYGYGSGQIPGPPACPFPGLDMYSQSLEVRERHSGDIARIHVSDFRRREISGRQVRWFVHLRGSLPSERFRMNRKFEGSVRSRPVPWLDGRAVFEPHGSLERSGWYECRGEREARTVRRDGAIRGDLSLKVIGYGERTISERRAGAVRAWVRPLD